MDLAPPMAMEIPERLIVGLGNPGPEYAPTRHNIGFRVIDALGAKQRIPVENVENGAVFGVGTICSYCVSLVKPMRYMNRSGEPMEILMTQWGLTCREMIVIHDDMDLAFGRIKIKTKGGDGGHRGIRSLVDACGDDRFCRIRVGIGRSAAGADAADHVLSGFDENETAALSRIIDAVGDATIAVLCEGSAAAMNRYNRRSSDNS